MYSLFRLLFKKSYWRMLFRNATWYEAWLNLKRVHKDARARRSLRQFAIWLLIPFACLSYILLVIGTGTLFFIIPIFVGVFWWRNWRDKQDTVSLRITPTPGPVERVLTKEEKQSLRLYLAEMTIVYAVMIDRAGSEGFLKNKVLPEGIQIISRRIHIDLLKQKNLWDHMSPQDRIAMMVADGNWDWPLINEVASGLEALRLLRWILRIDYFLPLVGMQLTNTFKIASELILSSQSVIDGTEMRDLDGLRVGREAASQYFLRCWAEGISRGYFKPHTDGGEEWANSISERLSGQQNKDYVLGDKLVSEVGEDELRWATQLSHRRLRFLNWIIELMEGNSKPITPFPALHSIKEA